MSRQAKHMCCVPYCKADTSDKSLKFFRVIRKKEEITNLWISAISRVNEDLSPWYPSESTRICSQHFEDGDPKSLPTLKLPPKDQGSVPMKRPNNYKPFVSTVNALI